MDFTAVEQRQTSRSNRAHSRVLFLFHFLLLLGYAGAGWVLCAYAVPKIVWLGTLLVTLHLISVGWSAVLPAFIWVSAVLSIATIDQTWMWHMPIEAYAAIPLILLLVWWLALGLVFLVAIAHHDLTQKRIFVVARSFFLTVPISLGLFSGVCLYRLLTFPQIQ